MIWQHAIWRGARQRRRTHEVGSCMCFGLFEIPTEPLVFTWGDDPVSQARSAGYGGA